jgi:hypothetical protein
MVGYAIVYLGIVLAIAVNTFKHRDI